MSHIQRCNKQKRMSLEELSLVFSSEEPILPVKKNDKFVWSTQNVKTSFSDIMNEQKSEVLPQLPKIKASRFKKCEKINSDARVLSQTNDFKKPPSSWASIFH